MVVLNSPRLLTYPDVPVALKIPLGAGGNTPLAARCADSEVVLLLIPRARSVELPSALWASVELVNRGSRDKRLRRELACTSAAADKPHMAAIAGPGPVGGAKGLDCRDTRAEKAHLVGCAESGASLHRGRPREGHT